MSGHTAQRTLVKSPPELWAELSDAASLAKHLGEFGEIRITRLEPETVVAWEGDRANGTVSLEPAGWGTRVTLTATALAIEPEPEPVVPEPEPEPEPVAELIETPAHEPKPEPVEAESVPEIAIDTPPEPAPRLTLLGRVKRWFAPSGEAAMWQLSDELPATPPAEPEPEPEPEPIPFEPRRPEPEPEPEPEPPAAAEAEPGPVTPADPVPVALDEDALAGVLADVLDTLGAAHHRPFSRR